mgnify:CR=1 FL=1
MTQTTSSTLQVPVDRRPPGLMERLRLAWLPWLLKVSCFVSIALGLLSLLCQFTGQMTVLLRRVLVSPDEALGLIFLGFAVRGVMPLGNQEDEGGDVDHRLRFRKLMMW